MVPKNRLLVMSQRATLNLLGLLCGAAISAPSKHSSTHRFYSEAKLGVFVGCCKQRAKEDLSPALW